jgi:Flp pilus assembly protein TadD
VRSISLTAIALATSIAAAQMASAQANLVVQCRRDYDAMDWPSALASCSVALSSGGLSTDQRASILKTPGMTHDYLRNYDAALRHLDEVIRLKPDDEPGYNDRGIVHEHRKDCELAI